MFLLLTLVRSVGAAESDAATADSSFIDYDEAPRWRLDRDCQHDRGRSV